MTKYKAEYNILLSRGDIVDVEKLTGDREFRFLIHKSIALASITHYTEVRAFRSLHRIESNGRIFKGNLRALSVNDLEATLGQSGSFWVLDRPDSVAPDGYTPLLPQRWAEFTEPPIYDHPYRIEP